MHMIYEYWLAAVSGVPSGRKRQLSWQGTRRQPIIWKKKSCGPPDF